VAQAVEHLPSNHKTLSLNLNTTKTKNKNKIEGHQPGMVMQACHPTN
jgi:hypothetical protein